MMTKRREFRETLKLIEILKNKYNKYQEKSSVNFFEIRAMSGQAGNKKYTMESLILAQDER